MGDDAGGESTGRRVEEPAHREATRRDANSPGGAPEDESAEAVASDANRDFEPGVLGRGLVAFLVAATYTVVAAVASLVPEVAVAGAPVNVAVWSAVLVVGIVAAAWLGADVGRRYLSFRSLVVFVATAWLVLVPLFVAGEMGIAPTPEAGPVDVFLYRLVAFAVATGVAAWMAYGGGWTRIRSRT